MPFDSLPELDNIDLLLRSARHYVEEGWCQHKLHEDNHSKHCVLGAIRQANGWKKNALYYDAVRRFVKTLPRLPVYCVGDYVRAISLWNDRRSRTKQQVLKQFDKVLVSV